MYFILFNKLFNNDNQHNNNIEINNINITSNSSIIKKAENIIEISKKLGNFSNIIEPLDIIEVIFIINN